MRISSLSSLDSAYFKPFFNWRGSVHLMRFSRIYRKNQERAQAWTVECFTLDVKTGRNENSIECIKSEKNWFTMCIIFCLLQCKFSLQYISKWLVILWKHSTAQARKYITLRTPQITMNRNLIKCLTDFFKIFTKCGIYFSRGKCKWALNL